MLVLDASCWSYVRACKSNSIPVFINVHESNKKSFKTLMLLEMVGASGTLDVGGADDVGDFEVGISSRRML